VVYHPQKRVGFGFTDGEGCERVWASLQKLIPGLRVSGVRDAKFLVFKCFSDTSCQPHRRLYLLNLQLGHSTQQNLIQLGKWFKKKSKVLENKKQEASAYLKTIHISMAGLRSQWAEQRADVTEKPPSMLHSKAVFPTNSDHILPMVPI
jgi:Kyakuja-Dileera-Zisupton transposase